MTDGGLQRRYNYYQSQYAELLGMVPRAPILVYQKPRLTWRRRVWLCYWFINCAFHDHLEAVGLWTRPIWFDVLMVGDGTASAAWIGASDFSIDLHREALACLAAQPRIGATIYKKLR